MWVAMAIFGLLITSQYIESKFRISDIEPSIEQLTWSNLTKIDGPQGIAGQGMVYVSSLRKVLMFGGQDSTYRTLNDMWLFDTSNAKWDKVISNPPLGRGDPVLSYIPDDGHGKDIIFLFGGWYNDSLGKVGRLSDTWYYYPSENRWQQIKTIVHPSARSDSAFAYDSKRKILLIYGGYNGSYLSDLWVYSFINSSWFKIEPNSELSPPPLADARMEYDKRNDIFIMFGGNNDFNKTKGFNHYSSTWAFNISSLAWVNMTQPNHPPARDYSFFTYDEDMGVFMLYGGYGEGVALDDVWVYSFTTNTWIKLDTKNTPPARFAGGFVYDPMHKLYFMFGGLVGEDYLNDIWAFRYFPDVRIKLEHTAALTNIPIQFKVTISNNVTSIKEYKWDFGDGSNSNYIEPPHTFENEGRYNVTILLKDELGQEFKDSFLIFVEPKFIIIWDSLLLSMLIIPSSFAIIKSLVYKRRISKHNSNIDRMGDA